MKNIKGFTLIEILVVIALLGVLGLILTNILTQVLRGQNKINTINLVKQNGQLVLDKLSNEIRSAEKVTCVGKNTNNTGSSLNDSIVIFKSGNYTRFRFVPPSLLNSPATNGYITREDFTKNDLLNTVTDPYLCTEGIPRNLNSLTDQNNNGISINYDPGQHIFRIDSKTGSPDLIYIRFRASESRGVNKTAENTVAEGGVLFTTAVAVRGGK